MCVVCVSGVDLQFAVWSFLQFCTHESLEAKMKPGQTQKARKVMVFQMDRYHVNLQQRVCSHARARRLTLLQFLPQKRGTCSSRCSFARWLFPYQPMSVSLYSTVLSSSLDAYAHQAAWYEEVFHILSHAKVALKVCRPKKVQFLGTWGRKSVRLP